MDEKTKNKHQSFAKVFATINTIDDAKYLPSCYKFIENFEMFYGLEYAKPLRKRLEEIQELFDCNEL